MIQFVHMQGLVKTRLFLTLVSVVVVVAGTVAVILFARGYRPNPATNSLSPTGILVAQSYPDGAQIYLNGQLKSATNASLNLSPGRYAVAIKMAGFIDWQKDLVIKAEEVTRATAWLFPSVASLRAVTATGATRPAASPDGSKVAYLLRQNNLTRLYTLDLSESPLGLLNRESKLITTLPNSPQSILNSQLIWSPDSRSLLLPASSSAIMVNLNSSQITDVSDRLDLIISTWHSQIVEQNTPRLSLLPKPLRDILATTGADIVWSPKEDKILYTATASAVIPDGLIKPLPGSSTQTQVRALESGRVYVYDVEEDTNFLLGDALPPSPTPRPSRNPIPIPADLASQIGYYHPGGFSWFPTSHHLVKANGGRVTIVEYDSTNSTTVYTGPLEDSFAAAYPSTKQLLILTNLNPDTSLLPNLYAVSLR